MVATLVSLALATVPSRAPAAAPNSPKLVVDSSIWLGDTSVTQTIEAEGSGWQMPEVTPEPPVDLLKVTEGLVSGVNSAIRYRVEAP